VESMESMTRAVLYARVSTDAQEKEGTIKSQLFELKRQIAAAGDVLVKEYVDDGCSGTRLDRPALEQLRADLKTGLFDTVYFHSADRIVNLGDGHASWDNGFGYTYFNATTGFEFSAVSGLTYNFTNPHTDYQNGIDWHVDLEASRFLTKQFYVGAVGYTFNQLTGDTGSGATLGPYISRISAVGPEVGLLFPVGGCRVP